MKKYNKYLFFMFLICLALTSLKSEVVEEIIAVINDETITYSEYQNAENAMIMQMQSQYKGDALQKAIKAMKKQLLNQLIEHKLILSKAKEKNYDIENEVNMIIEEIKKQNNMKTNEELKRALQKEGITFEEFKRQQKIVRMQQRMIYEEVTSKINIDNPEIMEYYKKNSSEFTKPMEFTLNCIFLNSEYYFDRNVLEAKQREISSKLTDNNFEEIAQQYSELEGTENKFFLGSYKKGELNEKIENAALKLNVNEYSPWIETENGWYIVQLTEKIDAKQIDYKDVRDNIKDVLIKEKQEVELRKFINKLKKESYINIYKKFN